jgi:hypothetical protein
LARLRYNNSLGTLGALLSSGGTTITFASAPSFATLSGGDYIPLVIEPPSSSPSANFEIVYLTAYTAAATTGTILRGQEGTSASSHVNGAVWACAPVVSDVLQSRRIATFATSSLAANAFATVDVALDLADEVYRITTDRPARVRAYDTAAHRTADAARLVTADPTGDHGLLLEVVTATGLLGLDLSPVITLMNMDATPAPTIYFAVQNLDTITGVVTVNLTIRRTE